MSRHETGVGGGSGPWRGLRVRNNTRSCATLGCLTLLEGPESLVTQIPGAKGQRGQTGPPPTLVPLLEFCVPCTSYRHGGLCLLISSSSQCQDALLSISICLLPSLLTVILFQK